MKPNIVPVTEELRTRLAHQIAPQLTGFEAATASMMSEMMGMISEEWDRAASRLVDENMAIRKILFQAAELLKNDSLRSKAGKKDTALRISSLQKQRESLLSKANEKDTDLRISSLQKQNKSLRDVLTGVHAQAEQTNSKEGRALDDMIWKELCTSVERRSLSSANF